MIPAFAKQFLTRLNATPQRRVAALAVVASVVGLTLVTALWLGPRWTMYSLEGTGLVVELPAAPAGSRAGAPGATGPLFEMRSPHLAVVASGGALPAGSTPEPLSMMQQAMAHVRAMPGISDLDYRGGEERVNGMPCLVVAGTFRRDGVPSRLQGAFFILPAHHGHVLCFWSDAKGAGQARRVLDSLQAAGR